MVDHVRYFAHGTGSVYIHMRNLESPIPGFQHTILTWSWCKECKQVRQVLNLLKIFLLLSVFPVSSVKVTFNSIWDVNAEM